MPSAPRSSSSSAEQPGLEVAPLSDLEVTPLSDPKVTPLSELELYIPNEELYQHSRWRKWKKQLIFAVVCLIVIVILGAVLGVRYKNRKQRDDYETVNPRNSMNEDAALAITSNDEIFFQDRLGRIIQTKYPDGSQGLRGQAAIDIPNKFKPKAGSPLATAEWDDGENIYLFYLDEDSRLHDYIWRINAWQAGTLADKNILAYDKTQLAAGRLQRTNELHLFYQQPDGKIMELTLDLDDQENTWKLAPQSDTIGTALLGSSLAVVEFHETQFRLYMQDPVHKIIEQCRPVNGSDTDSWRNCWVFESSTDGTDNQKAAVLLIYHSADGIRSITMGGDERWVKREQLIIG